MLRALISIAMLLAVSACSAGTSSIPLGRPATASAVSNPAQPQAISDGGVRSIIGQNAAALLNRFGVARIDLAEGDARKLQFASATCVLDIYLYPSQADAEVVATHIEARQRPSGGAIDRANCIADIERTSRSL